MNVKAAIITAVGIPALVGAFVVVKVAVSASDVVAWIATVVVCGILVYVLYSVVDDLMGLNDPKREWRDRHKRDS